MPKSINNKFAYHITQLIGVFLAFVLTPAQAFYDGNDPLSSYYLDEAPIVLSATRLAQPQLEAPASVTIIDRALIKASGIKEIAELFMLVPGMQVAHQNGHYPTVTYHGLSDEYSRRMQVLIDGSSMYIPTVGGVLWSDLPLQIEDIERIEIIRGPNAASFGPNSFLGVINITTSHASQDPGFMIKATGGERGYRRILLRHGGSTGDLDYRINVAYLEDDGYSTLHDSQRTNYLNGRLDYRLTARDLLQINFGFSEGPREKGSETFPERTQQREAFYQSLRWEHHKSQDESFSLQFLYNYSNTRDRFFSNFGGGITANINDSQKAERLDLEFQHTLKPTQNTRFIWGGGVRQDRIMMPFWLDSTAYKTNHLRRIFGNLEWRIFDNLILNAGTLYEENSIIKPAWSPRIALNYLFLPAQSVRLIASRATRTPALAEKELNVIIHANVGNDLQFKSLSDPRAERADYIELGYHGIFLNRTLNADFKVYRQTFLQLIGKKDSAYLCLDGSIRPTNTCPVFGDKFSPYGNANSAVGQGYEIELNYRPSHRTLIHAGYSKTKIFSKDKEEDLSESAPSDTFNLLISQKLSNNWQISGAFYYRSEMEWLLSGSPLDTYRRVDITVAKAFKLTEKEKLTLSLTVQTALDRNREFDNDNFFDNRGFFELEYQVQ